MEKFCLLGSIVANSSKEKKNVNLKSGSLQFETILIRNMIPV